MDGFLADVLRGYSDEQLNEAMLFTLVNYLKNKGVLDFKEFEEFYTNNLNDMLKGIVERDRKYREKKAEEIKKED